MRKLYLASIKFKVGNNEFEETRLVASTERYKEDVSDDAKIAWKHEAKGTDRELISLTISDTLTIDKSDEIRKPEVKSDLVKPLEICCEVLSPETQSVRSRNVYWLKDPVNCIVESEPVYGEEFAHYLFGEVKAGKLSIIKN